MCHKGNIEGTVAAAGHINFILLSLNISTLKTQHISLKIPFNIFV